MALIWQRQLGSVLYQLRTAGGSKRLYSNGVLHTQYNPSKILGGGVWDLLTMAAMFQPVAAMQVLVLGVGGGAVIGQLKQLLPQANIIGIDIDANHLTLARQQFGVHGSGITLLEADAKLWLQYYKGPKFDLIVDDLFGHHDGEATRAFPVDEFWAVSLLKHLEAEGSLAVNFESPAQRRASWLYSSSAARARFSGRCALGLALYENCIGVWTAKKHKPTVLRENLMAYSGLSEQQLKKTCDYQLS